MNLSRDNLRRESRAYFRSEMDGTVKAADELATGLKDVADELRRDSYLSDAAESVTLLRRAANLAEQARQLAALAESKLPPVVR